MRTVKTEFPDFDHELPTLEGWEDSSWHNDMCPSISRRWKNSMGDDVYDLQLYVDYKDPALREHPERSTLYTLMDVRSAFDAKIRPMDEQNINPVLVDTDSWEEVLEAIDQFDTETEKETRT